VGHSLRSSIIVMQVVLAITAMAPRLCIIHRKLQPDSNVLRIHVLYVMKRKLHLHDGTVTVDTDKNRLVVYGGLYREVLSILTSVYEYVIHAHTLHILHTLPSKHSVCTKACERF